MQRLSLKLYFSCSVYVIRLLARALQRAESETLCIFCAAFFINMLVRKEIFAFI